MSLSSLPADVNAADRNGFTPLHHAAEQGKQHLVMRLLQSGADPMAQTKPWSGSRNPLHLAAAAGHAGLLPLLITPANLDLRDAKDLTPLQLATKNRQWEAAAVLVAAGASPRAPNFSTSPLAYSFKGLPHPSAAHVASQLLVAMVRDPGSAGLLAAAVTYQNERQQTMLHWAAYLGHQAFVACLVAAGADRGTVDQHESTPLLAAVDQGHVELIQLLATPTNINRAAYSGDLIALHAAAAKGHEGMVAALLAAGARPDLQVSDGMSALSAAAMYGHKRVATLLLPALVKLCGQEQGQSKVPAMVAAAMAPLPSEYPLECAQLLEVILDVLGPQVAREVCQAVQQQLQEQWQQDLSSSNGEADEYQVSQLAEALLLGWVAAEEALHAARQPLVARLQRLVPGLGARGQHQQQEQGDQPRDDETGMPGAKELVAAAELAAAADQEQQAMQLLGRFAALHLQNQPCDADMRLSRVSNGLLKAAYTRVDVPHSHPAAVTALQRAASFRPAGVYTTFLAAWVGARRQLQQLPQEVAETVVAAVKAAQQRQQQQERSKQAREQLRGVKQGQWRLQHSARQQQLRQRRQQQMQQAARALASRSRAARARRLVLLAAAGVVAAAAAPLVGWRLGCRRRKARSSSL